jgi:hypothetical protein
MRSIIAVILVLLIMSVDGGTIYGTLTDDNIATQNPHTLIFGTIISSPSSLYTSSSLSLSSLSLLLQQVWE